MWFLFLWTWCGDVESLSTSTCMRLMSCPPSFHERLSVLELFLCLTGIVSMTSTCFILLFMFTSRIHAHECFLSPVLLLDSWNLCHSACQLDALFSFVGEKCMHLYVEFGPPRRELPKSKKFLKVKNIKEEEYWMKSGAWRGVFSLHNTSKIYEELFQIGLSVLPLNFLTAT